MHFQVKMPENGRKNIFREKETTNKVPLMFLDVKCLRKGKNCGFGVCQQTSKVQCIYLAFRNLKISSKKGQQWSER